MENALYAAGGLDADEQETEDNATLTAAEEKLDSTWRELLDVQESCEIDGALYKIAAWQSNCPVPLQSYRDQETLTKLQQEQEVQAKEKDHKPQGLETSTCPSYLGQGLEGSRGSFP